MRVSRRYWYPLLLLGVVGLMWIDQQKNENPQTLQLSVKCLIENQGDCATCKNISVDPVLQPSIKRMLQRNIGEIVPEFEIKEQQDGYVANIQTTTQGALQIRIITPEHHSFQIVEWSKKPQGL